MKGHSDETDNVFDGSGDEYSDTEDVCGVALL